MNTLSLMLLIAAVVALVANLLVSYQIRDRLERLTKDMSNNK